MFQTKYIFRFYLFWYICFIAIQFSSCGFKFWRHIPGFKSKNSKPINAYEINLTKLEHKDNPIKYYKYVLILFLHAANEKLNDAKLEKIPFESSSHLLTSVYQFTESKKNFDQNFMSLLEVCKHWLDDYQNKIEKKNDYVWRAYNYRLIYWFQYRMRRIQGVRNDDLEVKIQNIVKQLELDNILAEIASKRGEGPLLHIEEESRHINSLLDLKNYGNKKDHLVDFCLKLKSDVGFMRIGEKMPYDVEAYEYLLDGISLLLFIAALESSFKKFVGVFPGEMFLWILEAGRTDERLLEISLDAFKINLKLCRLSDYKGRQSTMYYRNVLILFCQSLKKQLLPNDMNENSFNIRQLMNFPVEMTTDLRYGALVKIGIAILKEYAEKIDKLELTNDLQQYYTDLLQWLLTCMHSPENSFMNDELLKEISMIRVKYEHVPHSTLNLIFHCELYNHINTLDDLQNPDNIKIQDHNPIGFTVLNNEISLSDSLHVTRPCQEEKHVIKNFTGENIEKSKNQQDYSICGKLWNFFSLSGSCILDIISSIKDHIIGTSGTTTKKLD